jgi:hypothetical protein
VGPGCVALQWQAFDHGGDGARRGLGDRGRAQIVAQHVGGRRDGEVELQSFEQRRILRRFLHCGALLGDVGRRAPLEPKVVGEPQGRRDRLECGARARGLADVTTTDRNRVVVDVGQRRDDRRHEIAGFAAAAGAGTERRDLARVEKAGSPVVGQVRFQ